MKRTVSWKRSALIRAIGTRLGAAALVAAVLAAVLAGTVLACDIGIGLAAPDAPVAAGDTRTVVVTVTQTHRRCLIPIEETSIVLTGAVLESQTPWQETSEGTYQSELTVRFPEPGGATVQVLRECSKGGGEATLEVQVMPGASAAPVITPTEPQSSPSPTPSAVATSPTPEPRPTAAGPTPVEGQRSPSAAPQPTTPTEPGLAPVPVSLLAQTPSAPSLESSESHQPPVTDEALAVAAAEDSPVTPAFGPAKSETATSGVQSPREGTAPTAAVSAGAAAARSRGEAAQDEPLMEALAPLLLDPPFLATGALVVLGGGAALAGTTRLRKLTLLAGLGLLGFWAGSCICAFGALQHLVSGQTSEVHRAFYLALLALPVVPALLLGRIYCGWVCPMGAVQEFLHRAKTRWRPPARLDRALRYLKYAVLAGVIGLTVYGIKTPWSQVDPFKALFNLDWAPVATVLLIAVAIGSLFIFRPWCRYVCPLGALLALASRLGLFRPVIGEACTGCKRCVRECPMGAVSKGPSGVQVDRAECIRCEECVGACRPGAVGGARMTARRYPDNGEQVVPEALPVTAAQMEGPRG